MKLFGKDLFTFKKPAELLYDFAQHGWGTQFLMQSEVFVTTGDPEREEKKQKGRKPNRVYLTPKGIYELACLNSHNFTIKVDPLYLEEQKNILLRKLNLVPKKKKPRSQGYQLEGVADFTREEMLSLIERLENRKQISKFKSLIDKYPHTTGALIQDVLKVNSNLLCRLVTGFIPDLPDEAIKAMEEYNNMCVKLCGKKTHFYVIASKADFDTVNKKRDPILLAQSPFGFFWNILGAWDEKDMAYLGEL